MNYPSGIKHSKSTINKCINYANRGMSLEEELNITNDYYRDIDKAIIYKKPTPIKVVKANFVSRQNAKITEAYFAMPSTTDYNGIYKGKYIDFEAKETTSSTSFPLTNIHKHQLLHLKKVYEHNGISFIIVRFTHLNETKYVSISPWVLSHVWLKFGSVSSSFHINSELSDKFRT